jgi:hypothetical protein
VQLIKRFPFFQAQLKPTPTNLGDLHQILHRVWGSVAVVSNRVHLGIAISQDLTARLQQHLRLMVWRASTQHVDAMPTGISWHAVHCTFHCAKHVSTFSFCTFPRLNPFPCRIPVVGGCLCGILVL